MIHRTQSGQQRFVQPVPDPDFLPVAQSAPAAHARAAAHLLREHLPRDATAEHKEDAREHGADRDRRAPGILPIASAPFRQQGFDSGPKSSSIKA